MPFTAINFPQLVPYESFISATTPKDGSSFSNVKDCLDQSRRSFLSAKSILESDQAKQLPDQASLLTVAKSNMVVAGILAASVSTEVKRKVRFDFSIHNIFPVIKFIS